LDLLKFESWNFEESEYFANMKSSTSSVKKFRVQRRLNTDLPGLGKPGALDRRPYGPGQHGQGRKKPSEYSLRLQEKQKLVSHYGITEKQLQRFVRDSNRAGLNWVSELSRRLEMRLDNLVFRFQLAPSIVAGRQLVTHGHILVNGKKCRIGSRVLSVGDEVSLAEASKEHQNVLQSKSSPRLDLPSHLERSGETSGKIIANPTTQDVPFNYNDRLIAEYYATRGRK
jgi:small subunit ribosomal protein S4